MTVYKWVGGSSANWADPANWTPSGYPSVTGDTATIDAAGTYTVSVAAGETDTIDSLTLNAPGAMLSVNGILAFGGANSATITAGTLAVGSTGIITGDPAVTVTAGATFDISASANQSVGSLSGDGLVLLGTHNLTIGDDGASTTFSGTVQGAALDQGALIQNGTGTLTLDNATMTNNELTIANGNLAVAEGTNQIFYLALGEGAGNSGSATISGGVLNIGGTSPATLKSALQVGDFGGTGLVTQTGGTVNVTGSFNIGNQGGNGTYDLENGTLNLLGGLYDVGRNANGNPAGSGTIDVSGGVFDIQAGSLILGNFYPNSGTNGQGSGLMVQTGGTVLVEGSSAIYLASLGNGEYDLNGGMLEVGGTGLANHYQGGSGTGSFHMGGGTLAVTGSDLTTDVSVVLDAGTASTLSLGVLNASFSGAITGAGTLDITGAGTASFAALDATGTLELQGGTVDITNTGAIGQIHVDAGASATLTMTAGKTLTVADAITVDAGATLTVNGSVAGNPDVTVATGATLDVSNSASLVLGSLSGSGLVLVGSQLLTIGVDGKNTTFSGTLQGGALDTGQVEQIGAGTLTLDNATMNAGELLVGNGNLAVGAGTNQLFYLAIGEGTGSSGTATISGGVLNIGSTGTNLGTSSALQVGDFGGTGLVTQTGGTVNIIGSFNVGNQGGTGTYDLSGGTLNLLVGLYDIGRNSGNNAAGSGTVNVSGGLLDIKSSNFVLGNLQTNSGTHGQASGLLVQTGGIVLVEGNGAIYLSAKGNGEYDLDGGTLEVGASGLQNRYNSGSGVGALHMGGGTLAVTGSSLTTNVNIVLDSATQSTLSLGALNAAFSGTLTGAGNLDISGTGTASFSTLSGTGTLTIENGTTLSVAGAVGSGETIAFNGAGGTLALGTPGGFAGTITGFGTGDKIALSGIAFDPSGTASFDAATHLLTVVENGQTYTEHLTGNYTGDFFNLADDGHGNTIVTMSSSGDQGSGTPCYCRGTLILTDRGEIAVEGLRIGDRLITRSGKARPIRWIGRRSYSGRFATGNRKVLPIRIAQDALADNVPKRDLWVSPLHALYLDGVLIPAWHLVNGTSIVQVETVDPVEYFHLELATHDVIVADGAPAETFIDDDSRGMFNNAPEYRRIYPNAPRTEPRYCAPRIEDGWALEVVRRRINGRSRTDDMGKVA